MHFYFNEKRLWKYLILLKNTEGKKVIQPFLLSLLGFVLYVIAYMTIGIGDWGYMLFYYGINILLLIYIFFRTSQIFSNFHHPNRFIQELTLPISLEERFLGSSIFYLATMGLGLFIINLFGFFIFALTQSEDGFWDSFQGKWEGVDLVWIGSLLVLYLFFFSGSVFFRKSPVAKTIIVIGLIYFVKFIIMLSIGGDGNIVNSGENDIKVDFSITGRGGGDYQNLFDYAIGIGCWICSYFKLRSIQYRV